MCAGLAIAGALRPFTGQLADLTYKPIGATLVIAQALSGAYAQRRGFHTKEVTDLLMMPWMPLLRVSVTKSPSGEWSLTITLGLM